MGILRVTSLELVQIVLLFSYLSFNEFMYMFLLGIVLVFYCCMTVWFYFILFLWPCPVAFDRIQHSFMIKTLNKVGIEGVLLLLSRQVVSDSFVTPCRDSPPGSSVHGIAQVRVLEWVAISFSRGTSRPRDGTCISCTGTWILYHWATRETHRGNVTQYNKGHKWQAHV